MRFVCPKCGHRYFDHIGAWECSMVHPTVCREAGL